MTRIAVVTKSFAPDFDLCVALNRSVLDYTSATVNHHVIVPRSDLKLFNRLAGPRTHIRCDADFLPRTFVALPFNNITLNLKRPVLPVRGWILQQIVKLAAVAASADDVVLVVDSDVEFFRPFSAEMFVQDGNVRLFRKPNQIDERLPRHMIWHRIARMLLGLPPAEPPYPDYISSPLAWDPKVVRRMLARVAATTGHAWPTAIGGQLHFSECILYGVFIDDLMGVPANSFVADDPLCLSYWEHAPLNLDGVTDFIRGVQPNDIAAMIPSKSKTPPEVRKAAFTALRAAHSTGHGVQGSLEGH